jgi:hypothetical protein
MTHPISIDVVLQGKINEGNAQIGNRPSAIGNGFNRQSATGNR